LKVTTYADENAVVASAHHETAAMQFPLDSDIAFLFEVARFTLSIHCRLTVWLDPVADIMDSVLRWIMNSVSWFSGQANCVSNALHHRHVPHACMT